MVVKNKSSTMDVDRNRQSGALEIAIIVSILKSFENRIFGFEEVNWITNIYIYI